MLLSESPKRIIGIVTPPLLKVVQTKWQTSPSDSRKRKSEVSTSDFEALLEEDLKREKKRVATRPAGIITFGDVVVSSPGPKKLGPILSRRFGGP